MSYKDLLVCALSPLNAYCVYASCGFLMNSSGRLIIKYNKYN